jgi:hypothetical protein
MFDKAFSMLGGQLFLQPHLVTHTQDTGCLNYRNWIFGISAYHTENRVSLSHKDQSPQEIIDMHRSRHVFVPFVHC